MLDHNQTALSSSTEQPSGRVRLPVRDAPLEVAVWRGSAVESRHLVQIVIADRRGRVLGHWGDFETPVFARSAVKPLQALALVETGAADAFGVTDAELALACASHQAEPQHVALVTAWLARLGLGPADLECGPQAPRSRRMRKAVVVAGSGWSPVHNNCSGKHTGMLTTALHLGVPTAGYAEFTHPVQQRIMGILEAMAGQDLSDAPRERDGCSIPAFAFSLGGLAVAMARLCDPTDLPAHRADAARRVCQAWADHPNLVAGTGAFDSDVIAATGGRVLCKAGAEGVRAACLPDLGLGIAAKVADGAARASGPALLHGLRLLGALGQAEWDRLAGLAEPVVTNRRRFAVGRIAVSQDDAVP